MYLGLNVLGLACLTAVAALAQPLLLHSFEDDTAIEQLKLNSAQVSLTSEHATDGDRALKIDYSVDTWPNVFFSADQAYHATDWTDYGAFLFDAYNPEDQPLRINLRIDDSPEADGSQHCRQTGVELPPGRQVTVSMMIHAQDLNMRGVPSLGVGDINADLGGRALDVSHIIAFQFFLARPQAAHTVYIDNIRLMEGPALDNIVDRFGQYTGADWPGKVHEAAELTERAAQERNQLQAAARPAHRDEWGGWTDGPNLEATGWFRTTKIDGQWWLVTPGGNLFWSIGIDCVRPNSWGPFKGRQYMFTWLPEPDDSLHQFGGTGADGIDFYGMNLHRKYGADWLDDWIDATRQRMLAWGFNTVGNWSDDRAYERLDLPFAAPIHYGGVPSFEAGWKHMPDFYTDKWAEQVESAIRKVTDRWRDDPHCIGYFVDNELSWGGWGGKGEFRLVTNALQLDDQWQVKQRFSRLLEEKYETIAALNEAWDTHIASWDAFLSQPVPLPEDWPKPLREDMSMLLKDFATRYFSTISKLMDKYAPNQLYLGCRFAVCPDDAVSAAAEHCDVVSYNIYGRAGRVLDRGKQAGKLNKPVIIGEFHFGATDRGMFHTGLGPVKNQEERGEQYAQYLRTALQQPWCVGAHWFQYIDQPLTGRFDGENYNIGYVTITDTPHPELVDHAKDVNFEAYEIRSGAADTDE